MFVQPIQEKGLRIWSEFYLKPYKLVWFGGDEGNEMYLMCKYALLKAIDEEVMLIHGITTWTADSLLKKFRVDRSRVIDLLKMKIPKNEVYVVNAVLKSTLPNDFDGNTLESLLDRFDTDKLDIEEKYNTLIYINDIYNKSNVNEIVNHRFLEVANELTNHLGSYVNLSKSKASIIEELEIRPTQIPKIEIKSDSVTEDIANIL